MFPIAHAEGPRFEPARFHQKELSLSPRVDNEVYVGYGAVSEKGLHRVLLYAENLNCCGFWRISSIATCISFSVGIENSPTAVK